MDDDDVDDGDGQATKVTGQEFRLALSMTFFVVVEVVEKTGTGIVLLLLFDDAGTISVYPAGGAPGLKILKLCMKVMTFLLGRRL